MSPYLTLHKCKITKATEVYRKHFNNILKPTDTENINQFSLESKEILIEGSENGYNISIAGLMWVRIVGKESSNWMVHLPKSVEINIRPSLMPYSQEDISKLS